MSHLSAFYSELVNQPVCSFPLSLPLSASVEVITSEFLI